MPSFHERLKELRLKNGWTQQDLADKLSNLESNEINLKKQTISSYENGIEPNISMLNNIAKVFGVTMDYLTGNSDYKNEIEKSLVNIIADKFPASTEAANYILPLFNQCLDIIVLSNSKGAIKEFENIIEWLRNYIYQSLEDVELKQRYINAMSVGAKELADSYETQLRKNVNNSHYFIRFNKSLNNYIDVLRENYREELMDKLSKETE